jgi:hypothetical protein
MFEKAIIEFLGNDLIRNFMENPEGPVTKEYGRDRSRDIGEKLRLFREGNKLTAKQILEIYGIRRGEPKVITYSPDFTNSFRIIPSSDLIAKHNPSYFQSSEPMSLVTDKNTPRFNKDKLHIKDEEMVELAHLEVSEDPQLRREFEKLLAVLHHLSNARGGEYESVRTLFRSMIAKVSSRNKAPKGRR